mgnify:CR=1 FL=1
MLGQIIIALLIGYLFGSIQPAYFLSKLVAKTDIREHGSGNAGASNITAIMGWKYGFIVAFVDVLKAMLAVLLVKWIYPQNPDLAYLAGIMAILGHLFPFYMNFRGGKGVAALAGMMLGINWKLGILFMLLVALPALIADYIVVGSLTAFIALPITTYILEYPTALIIIGALMTLLAFYLHRGHIKRIINKEELKISTVLKRKKS